VIGGEGYRGGPNARVLKPADKFPDVFLLHPDGTRRDLPPLPRPMSYAVAGLVGTSVYVAEGPDFLTLDLTNHPTRTGLIVLGGDKDLTRWNKIQHHTALRDAAPPNSPTWTEHNNVITWIYDHHTGFNTELLQYAANRWTQTANFPGPSQVTTPAVPHQNGLALISGETRPGIRTPTTWHLHP
jgi:N-acetylneuraminate epimerase